MDPSGTFVQCDARAIGSASEGAQSSLQEVYHKVIKHSHAFIIIFKIRVEFIYNKMYRPKNLYLWILMIVYTLVITT